MADSVSFQIEGVNSLVAKLDTINDDMKRKGGRFALRKAANLIRDKAKEGAQRLDDPETAQSIADNLAVRFSSRTYKRNGNLMFRVGVKGTARTTGDLSKSAGSPTPHWRLLEFGTEKMAAQPFMRPALANHIQAATAEFVTQYDKAIDRALKRAANKAKG